MSSDSGSMTGLDGRSVDAGSSVGQTNSIPRSTSVTSGAAKVFREFKWGLLTLFLLMVVVIGLVYDGGRKKKIAEADKPKGTDSALETTLDSTPEPGSPPNGPIANTAAPVPAPLPAPVQNPPSPPLPAPNFNESAQANQGGGQDVPNANSHDSRNVHDNPVPPVIRSQADPAPRVAQSPATEKVYKVKPGDTLTKIANAMLPGKGNVKAILEHNKDVIPDANRLRVGIELKIPAALVTVESHEKKSAVNSDDKVAVSTKDKDAKSVKVAKEKESEEPSKEEYAVQAGDTLERIARKVFNDGRKWREIYEWNREQLSDPSRLRAGQILKLKHSSPASSSPATISNLPSHAVPAENHTNISEAKKLAPEAAPEMPVMSRDAVSIP